MVIGLTKHISCIPTYFNHFVMVSSMVSIDELAVLDVLVSEVFRDCSNLLVAASGASPSAGAAALRGGDKGRLRIRLLHQRPGKP